MSEKYTFFWSGTFSQWLNSPFTVNEVEFNTAEQFMMYRKALLFDDLENAAKIMQSNDPKEQKRLGRSVKHFNPTVWNDNAKQIVYEGSFAKFTQNPKLLKQLLNTAGATLVEASPFDKIWGIGMDANTAKKTPKEQWLGTNWLGEVLTQVREDIINNITS